MILETLIGGGIGALARLAPEFLKWLDRKNERAHELALLDRNIAAEKARSDASQAELRIQTELAQVTHGLQALQAALTGQYQRTGVKWVDAVNQTVRPFLTYLIVGPYAVGKILVFGALLWQDEFNAAAIKVALDATYTGADMAIVSGILNFFFLNRVFSGRASS